MRVEIVAAADDLRPIVSSTSFCGMRRTATGAGR
jgi:hypothetical protein